MFKHDRTTWSKKEIGEILKLEYGKPLEENLRYNHGKYPVYGANGEKARTDQFYHDKKSIIVGRKGSAGEINLSEDRFWPLDVTYFVTYNDEEYDLMYLYHLLLTLDLPKLAKGVKPGINRNDVYGIRVSIPPKSEQIRIVNSLNILATELESAIAMCNTNLFLLEDLNKSILYKSFVSDL